MKKTMLIYGIVIAAAVVLLQWMEYMYVVRAFSIEIYIGMVALFFVVMGIWIGISISGRRKSSSFERNEKAVEYLGISEREYEVLGLLAQGLSNKEMADRLHVSGNTIKTHLSRLYDKLEVGRRTQAVQRARELRLIR